MCNQHLRSAECSISINHQNRKEEDINLQHGYGAMHTWGRRDLLQMLQCWKCNDSFQYQWGKFDDLYFNQSHCSCIPPNWMLAAGERLLLEVQMANGPRSFAPSSFSLILMRWCTALNAWGLWGLGLGYYTSMHSKYALHKYALLGITSSPAST